MERKLFSYIPIFEAELESMLRPYDVLKSIVAVFKENEDFPSNQRKQSKRDWKIYPISASIRNPQLLALFELRLKQYKELIE